MPRQVAVLLTLVALFAAPHVIACISAEGEAGKAQELAEAEKDRQLQRDLVGTVSKQADTIVIASSLRDIGDSWDSEFHITQVMKGSRLVGSKAIYRAALSIPDGPCVPPSFTFRNTVTVPGETYLLYVVSGHLLRAMSVSRSGAEISLQEEIRLIVLASNKSLDRTLDR